MSSHPARLLLQPGLTFSPFARCRVPFQGSSGVRGAHAAQRARRPPSAETWQGVGSGRHLKARAGHRQARWCCSPGLRAACPRRVDMRCQDSAFPISPARTVPVCSDPPVPALVLHEREGTHEGPPPLRLHFTSVSGAGVGAADTVSDEQPANCRNT